MKRFFLIAVTFFIVHHSKGQDLKKINLIITVDDRVSVGNVSSPSLIIYPKYRTAIKLEANYYPGSLSVSKIAFDSLSNLGIDSIKLSFTGAKMVFDEIETDLYEIPLPLKIADLNYYVLKIYNTKTKPYNKIYDSLPGEKYTFESESPLGGVNRVRKVKKGNGL